MGSGEWQVVPQGAKIALPFHGGVMLRQAALAYPSRCDYIGMADGYLVG